MGSGSVNFDRAVGYYDQTRMVTEEAEEEILAMLAAELAGRARCLEIGVGSGRMALPLHRTGVPMAGVDISTGMLGLLVEKAGGSVPFPLAIADATQLPFPDASLGAGLASHVFHLIPPWREALLELVRVVAPGGVILVSLRGGPSEAFKDIGERFASHVGVDRNAIGVKDTQELDDAFRAAGAVVRELPVVTERRLVRPEEIIGRFERGEYSYTWEVPPETRAQAAEELRAWAREEFGPLDEPIEADRAIGWRAYDLPVQWRP